jgi:hypothetical protein
MKRLCTRTPSLLRSSWRIPKALVVREERGNWLMLDLRCSGNERPSGVADGIASNVDMKIIRHGGGVGEDMLNSAAFLIACQNCDKA